MPKREKVEMIVRCDCGEILKVRFSITFDNIILTVDPCEVCLTEAYDSAVGKGV